MFGANTQSLEVNIMVIYAVLTKPVILVHGAKLFLFNTLDKSALH
jgi:hypothetical protein